MEPGSTKTEPLGKIYAHVIGPDGKRRYIGRIDRKWWAPRAWWYRYVTFPRLVRHNVHGSSSGKQVL